MTLARVRQREPRFAVVGHVEWVTFARVPHIPRSGDIVHAHDAFEEPAGGGAVAAVQLARLDGGALLITALADRGFDRATVYRNLIDLADKGILVRTDLGDHVWRFELRARPEKRGHGTEHPHFVCTDCGDVSCLPSVAVRLVATEGAPKSLSRRAVEVHVKGLCDNCA